MTEAEGHDVLLANFANDLEIWRRSLGNYGPLKS